MGITEENIIENFVCIIEGGAGAGPLHRLRPKSTGFDRLRLRNTAGTNLLVLMYWLTFKRLGL